MFQHPNSRLTPRGRRRLVERVRAGESVAAAAREAGVTRQTAHKWLARAAAGEPLSDRRSRPRTLARLTPPDVEARVVEARREMMLAPLALAAETGVPARTCAGFVARACGFFRGLGVEVERVMTDNDPGYRSRLFNERLESAGIGHRYTRPYSPWQNGEVERMNRTLAQEWQYARPYGSEEERAKALSSFLEHYNWERPHSACGGLPPMSRVVGVNNVMAHNT